MRGLPRAAHQEKQAQALEPQALPLLLSDTANVSVTSPSLTRVIRPMRLL